MKRSFLNTIYDNRAKRGLLKDREAERRKRDREKREGKTRSSSSAAVGGKNGRR